MGNRTCTIDGCDAIHYARGWCNRHYKRWRTHGDPLVRLTGEPPVDGLCTIPDCGNPFQGRGWCKMHYERWRRHGDPSIVAFLPGPGIDAQGYRWHYLPDHPLAMGNGRVHEHRLVVFNAGIPIPDGHHVHHLNGVKADNRLENLAVLSPEEHARLHQLQKSHT